MTHVNYPRDYGLLGRDAKIAEQRGLASAQWYQAPIPRARMKELMKRSDGPAIRDTIIWMMSFFVLAGLAVSLWPSGWAVPCVLAYGVLYGSSSDSRWHECGHGTAFKTRWMNDAVYQIACFMIMRNPTAWRWSHTRHHTDTVIVGRDPEIALMRPTYVAKVIGMFFAIPQVIDAFQKMFGYALGHISPAEQTYIPEMERARVIRDGRIQLSIHIAALAASLFWQTWWPVLFVGCLPTMYGAWVHVMTGLTQHGGLNEDVLDHRLNSRTVYMNPVLRFIYWNMNYHVEHHMFPMVPYHRLPELHEELKPYLPAPSPSVFAAYREIIPALIRQIKDPTYALPRRLPDGIAPVTTAMPAE